MSHDDAYRFIDEYEQDVDEIVAACRGDLRGAVRARGGATDCRCSHFRRLSRR